MRNLGFFCSKSMKIFVFSFQTTGRSLVAWECEEPAALFAQLKSRQICSTRGSWKTSLNRQWPARASAWRPYPGSLCSCGPGRSPFRFWRISARTASFESCVPFFDWRRASWCRTAPAKSRPRDCSPEADGAFFGSWSRSASSQAFVCRSRRRTVGRGWLSLSWVFI